MTSFAESVRVERFPDASYFAADLFRECFGSAFPAPRELTILGQKIEARDWRQFVAFYKWPDVTLEPVGFCNWIRFGEVYLGGGLCVRHSFYRRLTREHFRECREAGGIAQLVMEHAARELCDLPAWFSHCGDRKAFLVDLRVGFVATEHEHLIAKWFGDVPEEKKRAIASRIAQIGPF